ncbi:uncharacterized protein LOC133305628 [Gastrolobium bilobum]|uniref:uncharacterized protein LOC133305628 n=1 Tax=Gastrolobium bilobum TaxID=150636 RepID=UPI002AB293B6|nr:uncharacterized protein LOC133305628 [Gastrolobium bilobum]
MTYRLNFSILALFETKISGIRGDRIIKKLGFSKSFKKDAVGFSGGIWLLWDEKKVKVKVEIIDDHHQYIHTKVLYLEEMKSEFITFVYGSPRRLEKQTLWLNLESIAQETDGPWLVLGDFNSVLNASEKIGGKEICWSSLNDIQECFSSCDISDIGFKGPDFTWKRGKLQERLDKACSNEAWNLSWPNSILSHLPYFNSDHRHILLIQDQVYKMEDKDKPFRFLASWMTVEGFEEVVKDRWSNQPDWNNARRLFEMKAKDWHHNVYRMNIKKKNKIYAGLSGIDSYKSGLYDHNMEILQRSLWMELQEILVREELAWFQRS